LQRASGCYCVYEGSAEVSAAWAATYMP